MGRPTKNGLDYFPVDTDIFEDEKFLYLFSSFGAQGESIVLRLFCRIYRNGGFIKWDNDSQKLFSIPVAKKINRKTIDAVVDECLERGIFDLPMFQNFTILTSKGIQKRIFSISKMLHREMTLPESYLISSEETTSRLPVNSEKSAQIKEKEIKEKGSKGVSSEETQKPSPNFKADKKQLAAREEKPAYYDSLKTLWLAFYEKNFSAPPSFARSEEIILGALLEKMFARMTVTKTPLIEENALKLFTLFLERAFEDHWLQDHFLLSNLLKQFDSILSLARTPEKSPAKVHIPLAELYERFLSGTGIFPRVTEEHYSEIGKHIRITREVQEKAIALRMKELETSNAHRDTELLQQYLKYPEENPGLGQDSEAYFPLCKRVAVMFYFKQLQEKQQTINE